MGAVCPVLAAGLVVSHRGAGAGAAGAGRGLPPPETRAGAVLGALSDGGHSAVGRGLGSVGSGFLRPGIGDRTELRVNDPRGACCRVRAGLCVLAPGAICSNPHGPADCRPLSVGGRRLGVDGADQPSLPVHRPVIRPQVIEGHRGVDPAAPGKAGAGPAPEPGKAAGGRSRPGQVPLSRGCQP